MSTALRTLREATATTTLPAQQRAGARAEEDMELTEAQKATGMVADCAECREAGSACLTHQGHTTTKQTIARESETVRLSEAVAANPRPRGSGYEVVILEEGMGNPSDRNVYTGKALRDAVDRRLFEGARAYADHPTSDEARSRPERSVRDLVGHYHTITLTETSGKLQIRGIFQPLVGSSYQWVRDLIESSMSAAAGFVGISIDGAGRGPQREWSDGRPAHMIERIELVESADIVTRAGAGGGFLRRLTESLRGVAARQADDTEVTMKKRLSEAIRKLREAKTEQETAAALAELEAVEKDAPADDGATGIGAPPPPSAPATPTPQEPATPAVPEPDGAEAPADLAESKRQVAEARKERDEARKKLREAEGKIASNDRHADAVKVLREKEIPEKLHGWYMARLVECATRDQMLEFVDGQLAYDEHLRESIPLGAPARQAAAEQPGKEGRANLREAGIPVIDPDEGDDGDENDDVDKEV